MDNIVHSGSASVRTLIECPTQSVPALVHTASTSLPNCRASVRATSRRKDVPVAIPRTPPSFFCNAVMVDIVNALVTVSGASAQPDLPQCEGGDGESPGRPSTLSASRTCTRLDQNFRKEHWTNTVRTRPDQPQVLGCSPSLRVGSRGPALAVCVVATPPMSPIPGASVAPVKTCRARDTWPCFTLLHAASPRLFCSASWVESLLRITPILLLQVDWQSSSNKSAH